MSIRVGKYDYKNKRQPTTKNYVNILIHTTGELSPYTMKDDKGVIMENFWQFSKVWKVVYDIKQPISSFNKDVRWEHPDQIHYQNDKITPEYWAWREKGFNHDKWVRYPNNYKNHKDCIGSVIGNYLDYKIIDYIEARKVIYLPKYKEIAVKTKKFKKLQQMLKDGINIQINEVDGPVYEDIYPYNLVVNNSIEINKDILTELINKSNQAFGHGYCLAACLLNIDL